MAKAIQITDEAYDKLLKGRWVAIQKADEEGDKDLAGELRAMGIGAFAGWLILNQLQRLGVKIL